MPIFMVSGLGGFELVEEPNGQGMREKGKRLLRFLRPLADRQASDRRQWEKQPPPVIGKFMEPDGHRQGDDLAWLYDSLRFLHRGAEHGLAERRKLLITRKVSSLITLLSIFYSIA